MHVFEDAIIGMTVFCTISNGGLCVCEEKRSELPIKIVCKLITSVIK